MNVPDNPVIKSASVRINELPAASLRKFPEHSLTQAINFVVYGKPILKKYTRKRKNLHDSRLYIHEDDDSLLQWISKRKSYNDSRIDLHNVTNISDIPTQNKLKKLKKNETLLVLTIGETNYLALEFPSVEAKMLWWQGIQFFWVKSKNEGKKDIKSLSQFLFLKFDIDGTKYLDKKEIKALLNEMHINVVEEWFEKAFASFDKNKNEKIEYEEFRELMNELSYKKEVEPIFLKHCKRGKEGLENPESNVMRPEELQDFFLKVQDQKMDLKRDIMKLVDYYNENNQREEPVHDISFFNFCGILFSLENQIFDKQKAEIYLDMDQPLQSYWINSSHNTYLQSNQLTGESSTQAYVNAFQKGCRCVELDCWDGEKGEPIVYHGHTLTSKLLFADVIQTIKDYAFLKNPYPVILSIENHCSKKQQDRMAQIMENIMGSSLYLLPKNWETMKSFPSPNELKKKFLIKDKAKIKSGIENFSEEVNENVVPEECLEMHHSEFKSLATVIQANYLKKSSVEIIVFESDPKISESKLKDDNENPSKPKFQPNYGYKGKNLDEIEKLILMQGAPKRPSKLLEPIPEKPEKFSDQKTEKDGSSVSIRKKKKEMKTVEKSEQLLGLITIFGCKLILGDPNRVPWNISSLSEDKVIKQLQTNEVEFIDHNKWTFTRTYPGGMRMNSSNYDPMPAFVTGCQVIALNFQTNDLNLQIYLSKFMNNGGVNCGYLLKPDWMLKSAKNPKYPKDFTEPVYKIGIKIISGTQLKPMKKGEKDIIDPFVEVSLKGLPIEEKSNKTFKTQTVNNNGFNPQFDEECSFDVYCPEIAVLVFQVWDEDNMSNDKIGSYAIPVDSIRSGFRTVPLKSSVDFSFIDYSYIFCYIEKVPYK